MVTCDDDHRDQEVGVMMPVENVEWQDEEERGLVRLPIVGIWASAIREDRHFTGSRPLAVLSSVNGSFSEPLLFSEGTEVTDYNPRVPDSSDTQAIAAAQFVPLAGWVKVVWFDWSDHSENSFTEEEVVALVDPLGNVYDVEELSFQGKDSPTTMEIMIARANERLEEQRARVRQKEAHP